MRRQSVGGYPGICRVHRAEIKMLRGQWSEAEQEARQACQELERFGLLDAIGVCAVHRRRGAAADGRPRRRRARRSSGPTNSGTTRNPGRPCSSSRAARSRRPRARSAGRSRRRPATGGPRRSGDTWPPAPGTDRYRAGDRRPGDGRPGGRGARIDRGRLPATAVRGRRADGPGRDAARGGAGHRRRRRSSAARGGSGSRPTCPTRALGRASATPRRWRPTVTPRRPAGICGRPAARSSGSARRRDLAQVDALLAEEGRAPDSPRRADAARRSCSPTSSPRPTWSGLIGDEAWGDLLHWHDRELRAAFASHRGEEVHSHGRRFLRRLRARGRTRSSAPSTSSGGWYAIAASTGSPLGPDRAAHGRGDPPRRRLPGPRRPRRRARRRRRDRRGDPRFERRHSRPSVRSASTSLTLVTLTLKGVAELIEVRSVEWR